MLSVRFYPNHTLWYCVVINVHYDRRFEGETFVSSLSAHDYRSQWWINAYTFVFSMYRSEAIFIWQSNILFRLRCTTLELLYPIIHEQIGNQRICLLLTCIVTNGETNWQNKHSDCTSQDFSVIFDVRCHYHSSFLLLNHLLHNIGPKLSLPSQSTHVLSDQEGLNKYSSQSTSISPHHSTPCQTISLWRFSTYPSNWSFVFWIVWLPSFWFSRSVMSANGWIKSLMSTALTR